MIGKEIRLSDYQFNFGAEDKKIKVFASFKYKDGNKYVLFYNSDINKLCYGSVHIEANKMVILDLKRSSDDIIANLITLLINKQEINDYEYISLENVEKCEIIGFNEIMVNNDIISLLENITMPKPIVNEEKPKKKSKVKSVIIFIFLLLIIALGVFLYLNKDKVIGSYKTITCTINKDTSLEANLSETIILTFTSSEKLDSINITNTYVFNDNNIYYDFKDKGLYYKYMNEGDTYKLEDDSLTYKVFSSEDIISLSDLSYIEILNSYMKDGYNCKEGNLS